MCTALSFSLSALIFVGLYACCRSVCIQEDLTYCRNRNFLFPLCVSYSDTGHMLPLSDQIKWGLICKWISFKNDSRDWQVPLALYAYTQAHKAWTLIYLSQQSKTARLWVRTQLVLHYAFKHVYSHERLKGKGDQLDIRGKIVMICCSGMEVSSGGVWPLYPVSC